MSFLSAFFEAWREVFGKKESLEAPLLPDTPLPKSKKRGRRGGRGKTRQQVQLPSPKRRRLVTSAEGVRTLIVAAKPPKRKRVNGSKDIVIVDLEAPDKVVIRDYEDFHTSLSQSIDRLIRKELDKRCVRTILIWFWENEVIGESCYMPLPHLQKFVSKHRFSPRQFGESLSWLEEISLVLPKMGKSGARGRLIFLNLKSRPVDPGQVQEFRRRIAGAFYQFDRAVGR